MTSTPHVVYAHRERKVCTLRFRTGSAPVVLTFPHEDVAQRFMRNLLAAMRKAPTPAN